MSSRGFARGGARRVAPEVRTHEAIKTLKAEMVDSFKTLEKAATRSIAVDQELYGKLNIYMPNVRMSVSSAQYYNLYMTPRINYYKELLYSDRTLSSLSYG